MKLVTITRRLKLTSSTSPLSFIVGTHPDWLERIEELKNKRHYSIKTANERHRLKVESILAEYDFALKNISDEFQAAENEIIDEFTTKRKRKAESKFHCCLLLKIYLNILLEEFAGLEKIEKAANSSCGNSFKVLDEVQIQNDLSAINRIIQNSKSTKIDEKDQTSM